MKKLLAALLLICVVLGLCACAGNEAPTNAATLATTEAPTEKPTEFNGYTVTVVDTQGNPVPGAILQMCLTGESGACYLGNTLSDAEGKVYFNLEEASYKANVARMPEGYEFVDETRDFYFEEGAKALTIVVKASAE